MRRRTINEWRNHNMDFIFELQMRRNQGQASRSIQFDPLREAVFADRVASRKDFFVVILSVVEGSHGHRVASPPAQNEVWGQGRDMPIA